MKCEMNPESQRIAIAESVGWRRVGSGWQKGIGQNAFCPSDLPDYLNSLDAMHEVESTLDGWGVPFQQSAKGPGAKEYYDNLIHVCLASSPQTFVVRATAAERAEAYLMTIGSFTHP